MKTKIVTFSVVFLLFVFTRQALLYPPAVGILGKSKDCLVCHANNGPWKDDSRLTIDILDKVTKKSFKQADGSFKIDVKRGEILTVLTVIGHKGGDQAVAPLKNAWIYLDPKTIKSSSLSKFAPGWDVNLPMACRIVGDKLAGYDNMSLTVLPMSIRPSDAAQDADLVLQVMLTKGESVKAKPKEGMIGSYFERKVKLTVID